MKLKFIWGSIIAGLICVFGFFLQSTSSHLDTRSLLKAASRQEQRTRSQAAQTPAPNIRPFRSDYQPRSPFDESGYGVVMSSLPTWPKNASLDAIKQQFSKAILEGLNQSKAILADPGVSPDVRVQTVIKRARLLNYVGDPNSAYQLLQDSRDEIAHTGELAATYLYSLIYFQGVTALRQGENDNCILCRGESSCILPLAPKALHTNPNGSRLAVKHFTEYLEQFPQDLEAKWLLNIAHMTLGEHPDKVDSRYLLSLDAFTKYQEHGIGKFRDIGHTLGINRLNQAGGAIMDDFDNDGLFDVFVTTFDPNEASTLYRNQGNGSFKELSNSAMLRNALSGLNCTQADYDNDGHLDVLVLRGAWLSSQYAIRPSLYRNNGDLTFTDVTLQAGMGTPINSLAASWGDFDNDGWLDCFLCCEAQPSLLYRNRRDGTFEEISAEVGLGESSVYGAKGATWIDYDNDGRQDLFINRFNKTGAQLFRNRDDGTFEDITSAMGIEGPELGFACWSWDYDNDGYLDLFATSYDRTLGDVVKGLIGKSHRLETSRLYHNEGGKRFRDVTHDLGLDGCYATMGCNFADVDNDGFLDMYLGTGEPHLATLIPNRLFRSLAGKQFVDITASSGTGSLQKGHGVAMGDWDRDGNLDIFIEMGGAIDGDEFHNIMFQNPGNSHSWISVRLIGVQSNRSAIGARIKVTTAGNSPQTIHRVVSSGSSFGGNPLEQTIGLGDASGITSLEIEWPTSGVKQVFRNVELGKRLEIRESDRAP